LLTCFDIHLLLCVTIHCKLLDFGVAENILLQRNNNLPLGRSAMSEVWKTKNGPRKVRFDPPTLKEAIFAAQGLTGDLEQQAEIAAALMAVPVDDVRAKLAVAVRAPDGAHIVTSVGRDGGARTVIVERKPNRHFIAGALRPTPLRPP
jgi:hypothetical protein